MSGVSGGLRAVVERLSRGRVVRRGLPAAALETLTAEFRNGLFLVPVRGTMAGG